ncbi:twin-arginine translocase subunit TatC [Nitrospirota bacterium]
MGEELEAAEKQEGDESKLSFGLHLVELRKRIFIGIFAIVVGFAACFNYSEYIFRWLTMPLRSNIVLKTIKPYIFMVPKDGNVSDLIFLGPAEAFWAHMKIALISGIVLAMPVLLWQLWKFISPGLHAKEKHFTIPFVFVTSMLFFIGTSFCFFIVLPFALKFLLNFKTASLVPMISVEKYIDFCLKFILAFGVVFELPVIIVFLTRSGLVGIDTLSKNRKYAVLMAFVAAALLTPTPDAFNQTLMAVPIIVLYEAGLIASHIFARRKKKKQDAEDAEDRDGPAVTSEDLIDDNDIDSSSEDTKS